MTGSVRQGQFSFLQLRDWRDLATDDVLSLPDAVWVDLDEGRNKLAVGLATGGGQADIARRLAELGIPPEAVVMEVTGRSVLDVDSLTHRRRPLEGGLQIDPEGGIGFCTSGFNAVWNGQKSGPMISGEPKTS